MSELSKQALKVDNNQSFPNNNNGAITPAILRSFNEDMIDSTVNQTIYTADSASFTNRIDVVSNEVDALQAFSSSQHDLNQTLATTGSNTFTGNQVVSGSLTLHNNGINVQLNPDALVNGLSINNNVSIDGDLVADLPAGYVWLGDASGRAVAVPSSSIAAGGSTDLGPLNAFTASQEQKNATLATYTASVDTQLTNLSTSQSIDNQKWDNLGAQSGSWVTESETGSFARVDVTNNFTATQNITGDLNVTGVINATTIHTITESASVIYSSGSNVFGDAADDTQTLNGSVNVVNQLTASGLHYPTTDGTALTFLQTDGVGNLSFDVVHTMYEHVRAGENISKGDALYISGALGDNPIVWKADASNPSKMPVVYIASETVAANTNTLGITLGQLTGINLTGLPVGTELWVDGNGTLTSTRPTGSADIIQPIAIVTKTGAGGQLNILNPGPVLLPNIQTGYTWVGDGTNQPTTLTTSSLAFVGRDNTFTGTNTFNGNSVLNGTSSLYNTVRLNGGGLGDSNHLELDVVKGGVVLSSPAGIVGYPTIASQYSASSPSTQVNLILKSQNTSPDFIVSGSNNIMPWPSAPTAGFKRYTTNQNLYLGNQAVPQISGSMAWSPSINGNVVSHTQTNPITWRGGVSSSASTFNHNIIMGGQINLGTSAGNNFEKAIAGVNVVGNALFNGTINAVANTTNLTNAPAISGNLLFGAGITLNMYSSSLTYTSNVQNGGITVNNNFTPAGGTIAAALSARANVNTIYGFGHALNISGTNTATTLGKAFSYNFLAGTFLTSSIGTGDNSNILATGMIGNSLTITGSTTTTTFAGTEAANASQGSLFAGRFNAQNGTRANTGETVFAVGTGTGNTARKTGFLIDSGSNTFVEGSLNVSGSTSTTGSVRGNVIDQTITGTYTASLDLNSANFFEVQLTTGADTRIEVTNVKPGQTVNVLVKQPVISGTGTISFSSAFKFPAVSPYTASLGDNVKDIVTFITFADTSSIYSVAVKNLI